MVINVSKLGVKRNDDFPFLGKLLTSIDISVQGFEDFRREGSAGDKSTKLRAFTTSNID